MKIIRPASILIIGVLIGYGIAIWPPRDTTPTPPPAGQRPPEAAAGRAHQTAPAAPHGPARDAVVYVDLYDANGRQIKHTAGVLLQPNRTLIIPVSALNHARRGSITDGRGKRHPLQQVLGADLNEGLAAVATGLSAGPALPPAASDGGLYLGRELNTVTPDGTVKGWVDSAALQRDDGMIYYKVRTGEVLPAETAALTDSRTGGLIGMILKATAKPLVYEAVDTTVITGLLDALPEDTSRTLAAFGRYYSRHTAQGRLEDLESLAQAHKWNALIRSGQDLLNSSTDNQARVRALLETAYRATVASALNRGDMHRAENLLDQATDLLGDSASRLRLRAAVAQARGHVERARSLLHTAMNMNPALAGAISMQIKNLVKAVINNGQLTSRQKIDLLESEMSDNPDDPVYHQLLGRLYYRSADYQRAVDQLTQAVTLDGRLESRLRPLIDNAREKLASPGLTDAPLFGTDHSYMVNVRVNNHNRPLSFLLDTGSSYTAISAATARRLGIDVPADGPMTPLQTANGIIEAPVITLHSLNVNGAVVNNIDVTVVKSLGQYDGLLGLSFLGHFNFDINQSAQMLTLRRR